MRQKTDCFGMKAMCAAVELTRTHQLWKWSMGKHHEPPRAGPEYAWSARGEGVHTAPAAAMRLSSRQNLRVETTAALVGGVPVAVL